LLAETVYRDMTNIASSLEFTYYRRNRRGRDRMVVGCTTTCSISAYHH